MKILWKYKIRFNLYTSSSFLSEYQQQQQPRLYPHTMYYADVADARAAFVFLTKNSEPLCYFEILFLLLQNSGFQGLPCIWGPQRELEIGIPGFCFRQSCFPLFMFCIVLQMTVYVNEFFNSNDYNNSTDILVWKSWIW